MSRTLLIGQAPGPNTDPDLPLFPIPSTSAGGRLAALMGLSFTQYLSNFDRVNLLPYHPGQHRRDDRFPMAPAKLAATTMKQLLGGRTVIMVGRNVATAFGFNVEFHKWIGWPVRDTRLNFQGPWLANVAVIPHTSGRNHWYNNPENRKAAGAFWLEFRERQKRSCLLVDGGVCR